MNPILKNPLWLLILVVACNKDEAKKADCEASAVTLVNGSSTIFNYDVRENNHSFIQTITVNSGTDSSYSYGYTYTNYTLGFPDVVNLTHHIGNITQYDVEVAGGKLTKFKGHVPGNATPTDEIHFVYSSDRISEQQGWLANQAGTLFQVSEILFTYDANGNLTKSEEYIDLAAFFMLSFGSDPTGYSPIQIGLEEYEVSDSPNPLYGEFFVDQMFWCVQKNLPKSITYKNPAGTTIKTETLTLTNDAKGYPTKASISATKYLDATYGCR